ncbi:MAG: MFS transporter [Alphaproteobacteria bacterium]|nr:MFS transporter [Alphaproteobacteria bacterium]
MSAAAYAKATEAPVIHRGLITVCVMLATIMQALDTTIANVALPYMQGSLGVTLDQVNWVLTSYIVAAAIMTAPSGWLAVRFGRKKVFIIAAAGFTIASLLCGAAQGITDMVAYRLLQGVFGAALVPLSQAVMMDIYPPEKRGQAMAIWGMGVMLGPIMGPTLGGWLTEYSPNITPGAGCSSSTCPSALPPCSASWPTCPTPSPARCASTGWAS